jgi:hypothetical protein
MRHQEQCGYQAPDTESTARALYDSVPCTSDGYDALVSKATNLAQSVEQDWANETTTYIFADGSALVVLRVLKVEVE